MTGRLQLIEQKLIAIDPAGFQNLCDAYLIQRENNYSSLNRTGSQLGKQKTIPGTPDSFVRLKDNKLAYIEYTTQADSKVSKIIDDIDKCLDESKTGVSPEKLHYIIICFNSRLTIEEETEIHKHAESKNKKVELIGIDTLALEILSKYVLLSRDFLGIPIDTGQILPFEEFIKEYNNKANQLSTPLDNEFLHRDNELKEILNYLKTGDLILLSGAPGVGKTKIGIKAVQEFVEKNKTYTSYAITKKDVDIFEDLRIQLNVDKDYILLIDDANRQIPNLNQILGVFKETRKGNIKIIITVRNYALNDINKKINEFDSHIININKFTDEEITQIIESDSFKIFNNHYQKKIVEVSDGNARLAIMAARLANEKQSEFLWGSVSELFDSYFEKFIPEFDLFQNKTRLKVLGIISFFYTINRYDKSFIDSLLKTFEINYYEFNEAIEELHRRELIEIQYGHARISEQVMATYFFYLVFIRDNILSFKLLLNNFYTDWKSRFKSSVISSHNSFGYENINTKINHDLSDYLQSISENEKAVIDFLDLFWFYKPESTIEYFYNKTFKLPEPESTVYSTYYDTNDFVYEREQTIDFLSRYFHHFSEWFKPSIELGFEYIRRKPEHLPEFIKRIQENLMFHELDEINNFQRQVVFIDILIDNFNNNKPHYISAFFALAPSFLAHTFSVTNAGRKNTFISYQYPLPLYEVTRCLRTKIWKTLFDNYESYPNKVFDIIKNFNPTYNKLVPEIMDYDLNLLIPFISEKLSPRNFKYAYYVLDMIYWYDRVENISNRSYRKLKQQFFSEDYLLYCKLDWSRLKGKNRFEFKFEKREEYDNLKYKEIKSNFIFKDASEFDKLFKTINNIQSINKGNHFAARRSIDIVVKENFINNPKIGFKLLIAILNNYPSSVQLLHNSIKTIINDSEEWCFKLWNELEQWENENLLSWRLSFFNYLPVIYINEKYCNKLLTTIHSVNKDTYLHIELYSKFNLIDKHILKRILKIVADKIDELNVKIAYSDSVFYKNIDFFEEDYILIKRSYFQQYNINDSQVFDYRGKGFAKIFNTNPEFLKEFISKYYGSFSFDNKDKRVPLNFIWNNDLNFKIIEESIDIVIERNPYFGIGNHSINIFFNELNENQLINAKVFIKQYLIRNKDDSKKVNLIFSGIRNCMITIFEELFLYYLKVNPQVNTFKEVDWVDNVGVQAGNVNFGLLYIKKWEDILEIVNKFNDTLAMIPIKTFLKKKISEYHKEAENERIQKFLRPDW